MTDFLILAIIFLLVCPNKGLAEWGRKVGEAIRRCKGGGPGGPAAA